MGQVEREEASGGPELLGIQAQISPINNRERKNNRSKKACL